MSKPSPAAREVAPPAPARPAQEVLTVEDNVSALVQANPDAISFDPEDAANELLHLRCQCDPGIAGALRDGWRGVVRAWYVGTWTASDKERGGLVTLPSLVLLTARDELVRLTGWPAISSWATLLRAAGPDRVRAGLPVKTMRRASGTAGRSYWIVLPDVGG